MIFLKIVFVSNYFNHHQKPFCEEMFQRLGNDFSFISTSVMREERRNLGYKQDDRQPYVILAYENTQQQQRALELIQNADVVIAGSAPKQLFLERIRKGKLLLRYSERPFKKKMSLPKRIYHSLRFHQADLWKKNVYMLCAGAYTSVDFASIGMYQNRTYRWGYFPEVRTYQTDALMSEKQITSLMWCGRFVDWKHPDDAILLASRLKESGYAFRLNMVGTGIMEDELHKLVKDLDLDDVVKFLGSMPTEQVRNHMEQSGIYLFTSDRQEGWGAVLNEAMNSGCAVVASDAIGAVPFLLEHEKNGLIYQSGNLDMLYEKVSWLLDHPEEQKRMGSNAYSTIHTDWNASVAAARLCNLAQSLLDGAKYPDLYPSGPCSHVSFLTDLK